MVDAPPRPFGYLLPSMRARKINPAREQPSWGTDVPGVGNEQPFATIVDGLPVLVSYIDTEHRYRFLNNTCEHWFGGARDAALGKTVREALGPELFERVK